MSQSDFEVSEYEGRTRLGLFFYLNFSNHPSQVLNGRPLDQLSIKELCPTPVV